MTPALRWAAMRAILMFLLIVRDKVTRQCLQTTTQTLYGLCDVLRFCNWLGAPASRYRAELKEHILLLLLVTHAKRQNIPRNFLALMTSHETLGTVFNACQQAL